MNVYSVKERVSLDSESSAFVSATLAVILSRPL